MAPKSRRKRFPNNVLKASNLVRVAKSVGLDRHAIEDDVEYLLSHFISMPDQSFQAFDDLWDKLHFSFVHFACVKREFRAEFVGAFFKSFLDHFSSKLKSVKCGVIFSLYFMYISQPTLWGKDRIRVTTDIYNALFEFYVECFETDTNIEAALIFDKLREMNAFLFVAEQEPDSHLVQEKKEFEKAIDMNKKLEAMHLKSIQSNPVSLCTDDKLKSYAKLAVKYQEAKRETFYTPQALIATQDKLRESSGFIEKRPEMLQNVLLISSLAQDELEIVRQVKRSGQRILNSKRRKLEQ